MGRRVPPPKRVLPYTVHSDALAAIDLLIANDKFIADTKEQFALRMCWVRSNDGATDLPNVQRVHDVCALTKDRADTGEFAGMVIVYAPNSGGMVLIDPDSETPDFHLVHMLVGDLQRQRSIKTMNRRRIADWRQVGRSFAGADDLDMARLFWQAEDEIDRTGFVDGSTEIAIFKALRARGMVQ